MLRPFPHPVECCCMLLRVVGSCCAKFETGQTFSHAQRNATTPSTVGPVNNIMLGFVASFCFYLCGRRFTLLTDHQPLVTILGSKTGVPPLAATRMQMWSLILAAYQTGTDVFRRPRGGGRGVFNQLPGRTSSYSPRHCGCNWQRPDFSSCVRLYFVWMAQALDDPLLHSLTFHEGKNFLLTEAVCSRVYVFTCVRLLGDLHQEHHGICRMKSLAMSYFWWPGLDAATVERVQQCHVCAALGKSPPKAPLYPWKCPLSHGRVSTLISLRRAS